MARQIRLVTLFFIILSSALSAAGGEVRVLTLDEALSIAREKSREIAAAREYGRSVRGRYLEERSAALPHLSLDASAARSGDRSLPAGGGDRTVSALDLTLSQPLYTWGKLSAAIRAAEIGLSTADEELRRANQNLVRDVAVAFWDLVLAKELHAVAADDLEMKRRHADEAHRRFRGGVATEYDTLAADVALANARPEVIRSENRIRIARERLRTLLCIDAEVDVTGTLEVLPEPPPTIGMVRETAFARRPDLRFQERRTGVFRELLTIASAEGKPRLDLKGSAGLHRFDSGGADGSGPAWNVGLFFTFPFFDGFRGDGLRMQADADLRREEIGLERLKDAVTLQLEEALSSLREATELLKAVETTVERARRLVSMAEKGYELGVKTRIEVEDAQSNLLRARTAELEARRNWRVARIMLDWSMGVLGE